MTGGLEAPKTTDTNQENTMASEQEAKYQSEFRSEAYSLAEFRDYLTGELVGGQELEDLLQWASEMADIWGWEQAELEERYPGA